jgi:hypothetical protein
MPSEGALTNIWASPNQDWFAWLVGRRTSSRTSGPTLPMELMGALLKRAQFCAVTSREPAPCVRFKLTPTIVVVPESDTSRVQSADASNPSTSDVAPATGQASLTPLHTGAGELPVAAPQAVPAAANVSPGQVVDVPLQVSATSQMLCAGRQTVPAGARASAGQIADVPEQVSGASHPLATGRQTVPAAANLSAGHAAEVPVQVSAASQVLVDARQSVVAGANPSAGQALVVPLQVSGTSHTPFALRQTVPSTATASVGQVNDDPLQVSAASQAPFWARQTVPLDAAEQVPTWPARLHTPQPPLQAVSQQTPFAQNPVAHWLFDVHCKAKDPSKNTDVATAAVPLFEPPANRIKLLFRRVAVWP